MMRVQSTTQAPQSQGTAPSTARPTIAEEFSRALQDARVKFSGHALERMQQRNIALKPEDLGRINNALEQAARKGARESLFVMKNVALVVSITNRTVITAIDGDSARDNVFTNIDSAVML